MSKQLAPPLPYMQLQTALRRHMPYAIFHMAYGIWKTIMPQSISLIAYFAPPATPSELLQAKVVNLNEKARTFPPSNAATSLTVNVHVPFPFCPLNAASGLAGLNEPVKGAPAGEMPWINAVALSSSTVLQ